MRLNPKFTDTLAMITRYAYQASAHHIPWSDKKGNIFHDRPMVNIEMMPVDKPRIGVCIKVECFQGDNKISTGIFPHAPYSNLDGIIGFIDRSIMSMSDKAQDLSAEAIELQGG